jgi:hypothetical protein
LRVDRAKSDGGKDGGLLVYVKARQQILKPLCKFLVSNVIFYLVYRPPVQVLSVFRQEKGRCLIGNRPVKWRGKRMQSETLKLSGGQLDGTAGGFSHAAKR